MKNKLRWALRTLTGYKIAVVSVDRTVNIKHRPFRQPEMISEKNPKGLRGKTYSAIIYDEISDKPF